MACFESIGSDLPTGSRRTNMPGDVSCSETSQVSFHNLRAKTAKECIPFRARSVKSRSRKSSSQYSGRARLSGLLGRVYSNAE